MIAQAEHIPVHLGAMPDAVAAVMRSISAGRRLDPQRPVHRRHAPARRDARLAHRARLRRVARAPRGRRRHGACEPARVLARALSGGADHPADAALTRRGRTRSSRECAQPGRATRRPARTDRCAPARGAAHRRAVRAARARARRRGDGRALRVLGADGARRDRASARRHAGQAEDVVEAVEGELTIRAAVDRRRRRGPDRLRGHGRRSTPATSTARSR